jgi:hypothetical protein
MVSVSCWQDAVEAKPFAEDKWGRTQASVMRRRLGIGRSGKSGSDSLSSILHVFPSPAWDGDLVGLQLD